MCYDCSQPGHILSHYANRNIHLAGVQHHVDIGDSAAYLFQNAHKDMDKDGHKMLISNSKEETQLVKSKVE